MPAIILEIIREKIEPVHLLALAEKFQIEFAS